MNFFETSPAMPEMPRGINDPPRPLQTWAAPRGGAGYMGHKGWGGSTGEVTTTSESGSDDDGDEGRRGSFDDVRHLRTMPPGRNEDRIEDRPRPATMHGARKGKSCVFI